MCNLSFSLLFHLASYNYLILLSASSLKSEIHSMPMSTGMYLSPGDEDDMTVDDEQEGKLSGVT